MDNRRVMRAFRNREQGKVLPYPSRNGLLSRVKRYFSGSSIPKDQQHEQTRRPTQVADATSNRSAFVLPESSTPANSTLLEADQSTNRVLSNFFQEKGDKPLSEIEYEGVMSLLEKSKASITLPLPESTPETRKSRVEDSDVSTVQHNHTFAPLSKNVLRNASMYEGNSTSFATPDYKPIYHTFSDTSRGNISVKRVYQFSGLPSPYQTRIKAPNMTSRRAKRLESLKQANTSVSSTPSMSAVDTASNKVMSNTANSLLSILDGAESTPDIDNDEVVRPLYNPYAKNKKRSAPQDSGVSKRATLGADDIAKTVSFNKAEEVPRVDEGSNKSLLPVNDFKKDGAAESPSFSSKSEPNSVETAHEGTNVSNGKLHSAIPHNEETNILSANTQGSLLHGNISKTSPGLMPCESAIGSRDQNEVPKASKAHQSKLPFSFGLKSIKADAPTSTENTDRSSGSVSDKAQKSLLNTEAKISFGSTVQALKTQNQFHNLASAFSFGSKPGSVEDLETKAPGEFSFGSTQLSSKPAASVSHDLNAKVKECRYDFHFPPVKSINAQVDNAKVEQYKTMFEFI